MKSAVQGTRWRLGAMLASGATCALLVACASGSAQAAGLAQAAASAGPPPITVLTHGADNGNGDIFLAPSGNGSYAAGPEIITSTGKVIWFHPLPSGEAATDFRTQTYLGKPVLTWYQGSLTGVGGTDVIYNDRYRQIAVVKPGNGYQANMHEFLITPWNTALITATHVTTANLTSIGGPADQVVVDSAVQEIDISTGKVLFQWNSADHVPYSDSHVPLPGSASTPWDWFHINAVHLDTDGNLLISSRHTWTIYKVNRHTGNIIWELGGKQSSFSLKAASGQVLDDAGEIFAWQHDPEALGDDIYTVFDDESNGKTAELGYSRAVTIRLDLQTHVATLIKSVRQPEGLTANATGNAQTTRNGDLFVSWGNLGYLSEFSPSGRLLFNAKLPAGISTYRAYRLPWHPGS
jgi:hypothetical protein